MFKIFKRRFIEVERIVVGLSIYLSGNMVFKFDEIS